MKRGTPDHYKMADLARLLKVPAPYAIPWANGVMERLWHYAAKYTPQGDIGRVSDEQIAKACEWPERKSSQFISALLQAKWLDLSENHRLLIHDWPEHCDESVKKLLQRKGLPFCCPENVLSDAQTISNSLAKPSQSPAFMEGRKEGAASPPEALASVSEFPETHAEVNQPPFAGTGAEVTAAIAKAARDVEPEISDAGIALAVRVTRWQKQRSPWAFVKKVPEYLRSTPPDRRGPRLVPARASPQKTAAQERRDMQRAAEEQLLAEYAAKDAAGG